MKGLFYLTILDVKDKEKVGILGKIRGQIVAFEKKGINVHFGHFNGVNCFVIEHDNETNSFSASGHTTRDRLGSVYDKLYEYIESMNISVLYIRLTALDNRAMRFYKRIKEINVRIIIEFYSHNLEIETKNTIKRAIKNRQYYFAAKKNLSRVINKYYLGRIHRYVDRIVTTTAVDGCMYGIPTINVQNGITSENMPCIIKRDNGYDLTLISVAMISVWHGYDRIIKGIKEYYLAGGKRTILYYAVGEGEGKKELMDLVEQLELSNNVLFPGIKTGDELDDLYNQADLALEMLAGFRRTEGPISSIKMGEYFSKGIPVVYSTNEDIYDKEILKYCLKVPYDESAININSLFDYIETLYTNSNDIHEEMHKVAAEKFDWSITAKELHDYILYN